jgi:branched-chain amino acid transport system substrate-binding protein
MGSRYVRILGVFIIGLALIGTGCKKSAPTPPPVKKEAPAKAPATQTPPAQAPATKAPAEKAPAQPPAQTPPAQPPAPPAEKPQADASPIKVGAIFAVTGGASFLGAPEAKTAEMLVEQINQTGGINGHKVTLLVKDSGGKSETAVSLTKQLIDEEKVLAIIGPSTSGETMQIKNICQEGKTILLSCAAAETIVDPIASYVFKTPQKDSDAARRIYEVMKGKGITKVGVVSSSDGFGNAGAAQLAKLAPEYGMTIVIAETYAAGETDLTAVLTKLKGADIQAVINWSVVPAQGLVAKNMKQIGLNVPLFQSHGFGNIKYAQAGGEAANGIIFPCGRLLVATVLPDNHPQKKVLVKYKQDYETRYKEDASTFGGHAYDAILVLSEAIKKAGSTEPEKVRAAIETLQGVVGTGGVFNFSEKDHNGLTKDAFEMLTVVDGKFAVYTK